MLNSIKLNLINQSGDAKNSSYVVFQKNVATDFEEVAVAWQVIKNLGIGDNHPFSYPLEFYVAAKDANGNYTPQLLSADGQAFAMTMSNSGHTLALDDTPAVNPFEIEVRNKLAMGSIDACLFRDGKLLATKTGISPGQKADFRFKPRIFIGAVSQVQEGDVLDSAVLQSINTEIDLVGISSADIIIQGGGVGTGATPFQFKIANVR